MVKKARSVDSQEAIKKAKRGKISGWIEFIIGAVLISLGLNFFVASISYWMIFGGMFLAVFGLYSISTNVRKESLLTKELPSRAKRALKCPSCGRKIPQESFDYCPFCGHALKS